MEKTLGMIKPTLMSGTEGNWSLESEGDLGNITELVSGTARTRSRVFLSITTLRAEARPETPLLATILATWLSPFCLDLSVLGDSAQRKDTRRPWLFPAVCDVYCKVNFYRMLCLCVAWSTTVWRNDTPHTFPNLVIPCPIIANCANSSGMIRLWLLILPPPLQTGGI